MPDCHVSSPIWQVCGNNASTSNFRCEEQFGYHFRTSNLNRDKQFGKIFGTHDNANQTNTPRVHPNCCPVQFEPDPISHCPIHDNNFQEQSNNDTAPCSICHPCLGSK